MKLSIVATLYKSEKYIHEFYERASTAAKEFAGKDYEIVFVNDGSPDKSLDVAVALHEKDKRVKVVDFSRNFGHHKAMMTGLAYSKGDYVFLIDTDLEEKPEWLLLFASKMDHSVDVVYGEQIARKGGVAERVGGKLFYKIFSYFSDMRVPDKGVTARLMTRRYVDAVVKFKEQEVFMVGILYLAGFTQIPCKIEKLCKGTTSYNIARRVSLAVNAIVSFSPFPLKVIFYCGAFISSLSSVYALYIIVKSLCFGAAIAGWASLIASIWFLGGITISFLGIIGIYISKIFTEAKGRPYTIVRRFYER